MCVAVSEGACAIAVLFQEASAQVRLPAHTTKLRHAIVRTCQPVGCCFVVFHVKARHFERSRRLKVIYPASCHHGPQ